MKVLLEEMAQPFLVRIIEENKETILQKVNKIWDTKKDEFVLDGFRKGKVPQSIAEKTLGFQVLYKEYVDELVVNAVNNLSKDEQVTIIDIQQVVPEKLDKDGVVMQAVVYLKPKVLELDYHNVVINGVSNEATQKEIEDQLALLQNQVLKFELIEDRGVEWGDYITLSFVGSLNGVPFQGGSVSRQEMQLLETSFIPGFGEQILNMKKDESKAFPVTFPESYRATNLAGKDTVFDVTIHEIKKVIVPSSKEELAFNLGFESFETLLVEVKKSIEIKKKDFNQSKLENDIVLELLNRVKLAPIPTSMVHKRLQQLLTSEARSANLSSEEYLKKRGMDEATFERAYYYTALRDLKVQLVLDYIATKEGFVVSDLERENYLQDEVRKSGHDPDHLKKILTTEQIDAQIKLKMSYDYLLKNVSFMDQ